MANVPVRIIGVSGGGAPKNAQPGTQTGIVSANPQQAEQRLQNAAQYREDAGRTQVDAISTAMQSLSAEIQARSNNSSKFAEALGGLGAVAQAVTEWSGQRQEMQLQQRDDLEERLSSEQHVQALQAAQSILDSSRTVLQELSYEKGVEVLNSRFAQVMQQFPNLSPEAVKQIRTTIYGELNNINGEMWRSQQRDLEELQDTRVAVVIAQGRAAAGQGLMALRFRGSSATYEQKTQYFNQVVSSFTDSEEFRSLDPDSQLRAYSAFLEIAVQQLEGNEEAVQMAQGELERTKQSQNDIAQVQVAYENGLIDLRQRDAQIQQLNIANRTNVSPTSTFDQLNARLEEGTTWANYNQMEMDKLIADAGPLMDMEVGNVVANILSGRASVSSLGDDAYGDQVRATLELYNKLYTGDYETAMRQMQELGREEQALSRQMQLAQLYETAYNSASAEDRKTLAERMGTEYASAFNNRNANLQRLAEIRAMQLEGNAQMNSIREQLLPYGLHQGYNSQAQFYNDPAIVAQREAAAARRAEAQAAGQTSFNYGQEASQGPAPRPLAALASAGFGLAEGTPIPFVAGTQNIVITSGYHAHEGGRAGHNGVDFAPMGFGGAQVAAVRTGRVVASGFDDGGWGNYVAIEDQNGYRAVYGHLAAPSSVKVGDVVSQGQLLGDMGNTGGEIG
jgi:murein DD-endopeptidase MepM/ murein hydrolase activator NlpD